MSEQIRASTNHDPDTPPETDRRQTAWRRWGSLLAGVVVVATLALGTYALYHMDSYGDRQPTSQRFQLDVARHADIPEDLLGYRLQRELDVSVQQPAAIAAGPQGEIYVAGESAIERWPADDSPASKIALPGQPSCLSVAGPGTARPGSIYLGIGQEVVVLDEQGETLQKWQAGDARSILTAIALAGEHVFVADAGERVVRHYDADGKLVWEIGRSDPDRQMPGFVIPSPYFDLVADEPETLHVVNPGMRRVEAYDFDGQLQWFWGQAGAALPRFFGCCNPAHLAQLPDGRFVTSEKGIPRIKVYTLDGELDQVVAGPVQLEVEVSALGDARGNQKERIFDVAVDQSGNVLVLDLRRARVLVFQPRASQSESRS